MSQITRKRENNKKLSISFYLKLPAQIIKMKNCNGSVGIFPPSFLIAKILCTKLQFICNFSALEFAAIGERKSGDHMKVTEIRLDPVMRK